MMISGKIAGAFSFRQRLWSGRKELRFMISTRLTMAVLTAIALQVAPRPVAAQSLNYETFKAQVEPIFLKKRPGHARCVVCHSTGGGAFHLQMLSPGSSTWTEEQSRKNFEAVSNLVVPGDPNSSVLLKHPLASEAGGDRFHSGGRQFRSQDDPDWQTIASWVRQAK
jgi:hypothetical protein